MKRCFNASIAHLANSVAGSLLTLLFTSSTPMYKPRPRTSPTNSYLSFKRLSPANILAACFCTFSSSLSCCKTSSVALANAQETGLALKVLKKVIPLSNLSAISRRVTRAANAGVSVIVEGHADERGTREYNVALSERRAKTVQNLLSLQGAAGNQAEAVALGEEKPVVLGHEEKSWRLNRRVELIYPAH